MQSTSSADADDDSADDDFAGSANMDDVVASLLTNADLKACPANLLATSLMDPKQFINALACYFSSELAKRRG